MTTPRVTSTSLHTPSGPVLARLVDAAGHAAATTPREVAGQVQAGAFFWLDLEGPTDDELAEFCRSLRLPADAADSVVHPTARSSFARVADSVRAVLPAAVDGTRTEWLESTYVTVVLTKRFLLTVHVAPCAPLHHARNRYHTLDEDEKADRARLLFLVLDLLIGSFATQLLALDDRLGEIQIGMLHGAPQKVHNELIQILGILTDGIQELGWYSYDLTEVAETVDKLPGMGDGANQMLDRHHQRVTRMSENGQHIRAEAKDALNQYSALVAGRQGQLINALTIVATVFLPLSFLTGYFGMNFRILTSDVQNTLWQFLLLGLLLPIASAALSLLLIHVQERRLGIGALGKRST